MGFQIFRISVLDERLDGIRKLRLVIVRNGIVIHGFFQQVDLFLCERAAFIDHPGDLLGGNGKGFGKSGFCHSKGIVNRPFDEQGKDENSEDAGQKEFPFPPENDAQERCGEQKHIQPVGTEQADQKAGKQEQSKKPRLFFQPSSGGVQMEQAVQAEGEQKQEAGKQHVLPHRHGKASVIGNAGIKNEKKKAQLPARSVTVQDADAVTQKQSHQNHLKYGVAGDCRVNVVKKRHAHRKKKFDEQGVGEGMMVAVAGKPHGLAVLADAVRSHDAREIIEKPGKPAAQENNRKQHLHLKGKLLILCPGIFQALDAQRPFSQIKEKKAQAAEKQKKQAKSAHQKAGNLKKRAGQASDEYI